MREKFFLIYKYVFRSLTFVSPLFITTTNMMLPLSFFLLFSLSLECSFLPFCSAWFPLYPQTITFHRSSFYMNVWICMSVRIFSQNERETKMTATPSECPHQKTKEMNANLLQQSYRIRHEKWRQKYSINVRAILYSVVTKMVNKYKKYCRLFF